MANGSASTSAWNLNRPLLLFLDEPTSGLDPFSEFKMMELLRKLANAGCTVVCATHVVENVFLMDQIVVMTKSRLIFQGSPDSLRAAFGVDRLSELYGALQGLDPENLPFSVPPLSLGPEDAKELKSFSAKPRSSFSLPILAYAATGIGLTISTLARSAIHAVMLVPLILIPQILFSGHTVEVRNMSEPVRRVSELMPSFATERIEDVSFFLNQKIAANEMAGFLIPYHNVNEAYGRLGYKVLESGKTLEETRPLWPLWLAFLTLIAWVMAGFSASYFLLARKERQ